MSDKSLEDRVAVLERAVGAGLGIQLAEFDPSAQKAKAEAAREAAQAKADAEQAERDAKDAEIAARAEADAKAEKEVQARTQAILEQKKA